MRKYIYILLLLALFPSCHEVDEFPDSAQGNFEALWTVIDEHYCFLTQKGIDWDDVHDRYAAQVKPGITRQELFRVCSEMLDELRDGHVNLSTVWGTSYYRAWWSDYPQNSS